MNKKTLLERIAELVRAKQIEGIGEMRDESDRSGMRIVIELKRDATPEVVLNQLFRFTQLQTSFGINMLALDDGQPRQMGLKDALQCFIRFREEVILRRARFDLGKARDRAHQSGRPRHRGRQYRRGDPADPRQPRRRRRARRADGARLAGRAISAPLLALIDEPGNVIAPDGTVRLTEEQARGILELRLQRLTGLEREKIQAEMTEVADEDPRPAGDPRLAHPRRMEVMREELADGARGDRLAADDRHRRRRWPTRTTRA